MLILAQSITPHMMPSVNDSSWHLIQRDSRDSTSNNKPCNRSISRLVVREHASVTLRSMAIDFMFLIPYKIQFGATVFRVTVLSQHRDGSPIAPTCAVQLT